MKSEFEITTKDTPIGIAYLKDFTGEHKNIPKEFDDTIEIYKKFCINEGYSTLGIYFDNPKTNPTNFKASIGFLRTGDEKINSEMEKYLLEHNYKKIELKPTKSLYGEINYSTMEEMFKGIVDFYAFFFKEREKGKFEKEYKNLGNQREVCLEVYEGMNLIRVYTPFKDTSQFLIHEGLK